MPFGQCTRAPRPGPCDVTPSRPRSLGVGSSIRTRIRAVIFTANRPAKKAGCRREPATRADAAHARVWQPALRATMLPEANGARETASRMNQSLVQLIGFVVLAAIMLADRLRRDRRPPVLPGPSDGRAALRRQVLARRRVRTRRSAGRRTPRRRSATGRARKVSLRARLLFLLPLPLLFAGLGAIGRGSAAEMLGELGGFAGLMLAGLAAERGAAGRGGLRRPRRRPAAGDPAQALRRGADRRQRVARRAARASGRGSRRARLRRWWRRRRSSSPSGSTR